MDPHAQDCANEQAFYSPGSGCMALSPKAFDPKGFSQDLHDRFVAPLRDLRIMLTEHPYLTRLFTTLSPEEMAWDPMFAFNPDLPDVSNVHRAKLTPTCTIPGQPDGLTLDFADGTQWATDAAWDACGTPSAEEPAYGETRIEILGEQGAPEAVAPSQVTTLQASLELRRPALRSPVPTTPRTPTTPAATDDDEPIRVTATCGVTGGAQAGLSALLVAALLVLGRRRS